MIEVTLLHWHVAAASRVLAGSEDLSNAQVSILRTLHADGPQTVPQLAAARGIARQPVQRSVDELSALDLIQFEPNPRHRRSKLVSPTPSGKKRLAVMEHRQSAWIRPLVDGLSVRSVRAAARLLRTIRDRISHRFPISAPTKG